MTVSPKEAAKARALLRQHRKQRRAERPQRAVRSADTVKADRGRVRDPGFLAFLRRQPCCVGPLIGDACDGRTDPAHIRFSDYRAGRLNPGVGRKSDDKWCLPVCRKHHEQQHHFGNEAKWWSDVGRANPSTLAVEYYSQYNGERV